MDPLIGGALINLGGSLLGGLFGKKPKNISPADARAGDIMGIRQGAEAAGFNPLAFLGTSGPGGYQLPGDNTMGQAIADGVSGLASAWSASAIEKTKNQDLQRQNQALQRKVTVQTIRPKVGGLYSKAPMGTPITLSGGGPGGWKPEWAVDYAGKQVGPQKVDGTYDSRNPARTAIMTPFGETTPAPVSDAEDWEMRYGDPVSWAVGVGNLAMDAGASMRTYTDSKGWTTPGTWAGLETAKKLRDMVPKTKPPDGYTENGDPFWIRSDGTIKWRWDSQK